MKYTVFVLYKALPAWITLSRPQREAFFARKAAPIFSRYEKELKISLFDAEAFHAQVSDVMVVSCNDLNAYYFMMEALRDTELFSKPYIELQDVIISRENGFRDYEATLR